VAFDAAGNKSVASATVSATTSPVATVVTVYGVVSDKTTGAPIAGALVKTGNVATKNGSTQSTTNSAGQYLLTNIIPGRQHSYYFSAKSYTTVHDVVTFGAGTFPLNQPLTKRN